MFQLSVECLTNGAPHSAAAAYFLKKMDTLAAGGGSFFLRCAIAWELFHRTEALLEQESDVSTSIFSDLLVELADRSVATWASHSKFMKKLDWSADAPAQEDFCNATREHYGNLFQGFSEYHYYEEAANLLQVRLERNNIDLGYIGNHSALDAGCGGGRYSHALSAIGFGCVTGVDFSQINIDTATSRKDMRGTANLSFRLGNVLDLPFPDATFDFVFSNGVLHHTQSIETGVAEISRVLKSGGIAWLYIIERPGGLHWDMVELLRNVMSPVQRGYARAIFSLLGVPSNRIFYILDHIMVPINTRTSPSEVEEMAGRNNLEVICRFHRGADFDRVERIFHSRHNSRPEDVNWLFGVGENRYLFRRS